MRRGIAVWLLLLAGAFFARLPAHADGGANGEGGGPASLRTEHFEIIAYLGDASPEDAQALALQMEARFAAHNRVFRFDARRLAAPLRVRAFRDAQRYEEYVASRLDGEAPPGAVYLHFAQAEMRELVIHLGGEADALPFQAFIQFLRAFVPNPPVWMRDGFGVHFAALGISAEGLPLHRENLVWLDAVKGMGELPPPEAIMAAGAPAELENFPGLAWALVSFFLNSGNENYLRSLTESFMVLSYAAGADENAAAAAGRIAMWNDMGEMTVAFRAYVGSRRSFGELVEEGQAAYIEGRAQGAEEAFRRALEIRPDHYAPWYYLGLIAFNAGDTEAAQRYYRAALELGADEAAVTYALALNAATAGRIGEAIGLLRRAAELSPARFGERAEALIGQLEGIGAGR